MTIRVTFIILSFIINLNGYAQKQLSITIDDPQTADLPMLSWQERTVLF